MPQHLIEAQAGGDVAAGACAPVAWLWSLGGRQSTAACTVSVPLQAQGQMAAQPLPALSAERCSLAGCQRAP